MRYIVVGLGNIGEKRLELLGERCVATVDTENPEATYRAVEMVPDASYDAVVLATPNTGKLDYLTRFLSAGKHVLVEKPLLFPDEDTAAALAQTAEDSGAVWYTGYNHRFEPLVVELKSLLDARFVGDVYRARLTYGNGTVRNVAETWRDAGFGVLDDLGCHLLDLTYFLLGYASSDLTLWDLASLEADSPDNCVFSTADRKVLIDCSWTVWKNTFTVDVFGSRGSVHLSGLRKWGTVELITRRRVFPSGVPVEERRFDAGPDESWRDDLDEFERRVRTGESSHRTDVALSTGIRNLREQAVAPGVSQRVGR